MDGAAPAQNLHFNVRMARPAHFNLERPVSSPFRCLAALALWTSLLPAAFLGALATGATAAGAGRPYTVANYPVEARAENAVAAKEQAIAEGQSAAFRSLLKRIVPVTAYKSLERVKAADAATLLDGFAVRSERNSATEYIAGLDFSFQPDAVRNLLTSSGVPFVDTQAPETVLVVVTRDAKGSAGPQGEFRAASGSWGEVWTELDLANSLAPLRLDQLKSDVSADTLRLLYGGAGNPVSTLAYQYHADRIVLAIAEVDNDAGKVNVLLAGADAVGPFAWSKSYRIADGDLAYTLELAAVVSIGVLEGRWKAVQAPGAAAGGYGAYGPAQPFGGQPYGAPGYGTAAAPLGEDVEFEVRYGGIAEWNEMRRRLLETPGVDDIRISSVAAGSALVSVKYPGGGTALSEALSRQGLVLINEAGFWVARSRRW